MTTSDQLHDTHNIAVDRVTYTAILYHIKKAGVCKFRKQFKTGDRLKIQEYDKKSKCYTGQEINRRIVHITFGGANGIQDGYMLLNMAKVKKPIAV